ncbi:MAG: GNAT family protein [Clostridiaceae bacterium]|nr:GNAT family protein [Clostridiaceae bacterium]
MNCHYQGEIEIEETTKEDLPHIMALWNDGEVMGHVGFPEGLGVTLPELEDWLSWAVQLPYRCHYSIYTDDLGYCGETFYNVDAEKLGALDIKLTAEARGKGIAGQALAFAIGKAFGQGKAERVYVDPHPENAPALRLYDRLGFVPQERPEHLEPAEDCLYLELARDAWMQD